ncbi:MAG TPA: hypothetical protein PKD55_10580 [Bellilinea sp.]|nr:hypothetical protein [Bellilinea sp.]
MSDKRGQIFQEVPNDIDATWTHVTLFGGMVDGAHDDYTLAWNFKQAGDILIQHGLKVSDACDLLYPVLYSYRHAIELFLKAIVKPAKRKHHDLARLLDQFEEKMKQNHNVEVPTWIQNLIGEFIQYDPGSTTFRYPEQTNTAEELMISLPDLKEKMDVLSENFHRVHLAEIEVQRRKPQNS